jgi:hypothetical protein
MPATTTHDPRPSIRVLAYNAANVHHLRTVNIVAAAPVDPHHSIKEYLQLTAAQYSNGIHEQVMAAGSTQKGLPTIYINGYTAPN